MRRLTLSILAAVFVASPALAQPATWTISDISPKSVAPAREVASGGRVNGLGRADRETYYAASEGGGIFRTTDHGVTWSYLPGHLPQATWDVEVDPANKRRLFATSLYDGKIASLAGINVSEDGGDTWRKPATATPPEGFCARDTDGRDSRRSEPSAFGIAIDKADARRVYVGTNCGLAISRDGGVTWRYVDPTPDDAADIIWDVVVHHGVIDVCGGGGHQRSTTSGATWTTPAISGFQPTGKKRLLPSGRCSIAASPNEKDVLFAAVGASVYESDDGGATWRGAPLTADEDGYALTIEHSSAKCKRCAPQGRIPFVATNKRSDADFDLYVGDVALYRVTCRPPLPTAAKQQRCLTSGAYSNWRYLSGENEDHDNKPHADVGDIAFESDQANACAALFSNDGGVFYREAASSPGCHDDVNWKAGTITTRALWVWGMSSARQGAQRHLYFGAQDNGSFGSTNAGEPSPTWESNNCCDVTDIATDANHVVFVIGHFSEGPPFFKVQRCGLGLVDCEVLDNAPEMGSACNFSYGSSIASFDVGQFVLLTEKGAFVTTNIAADPVIWNRLGRPADLPYLPNRCLNNEVKVSRKGAKRVFYVLSGAADGTEIGTLFKLEGPGAGARWSRVAPPGGSEGGFGVFAVDPTNADIIIASHLKPGQPPRMVRSNDGGLSWGELPTLDQMMTADGRLNFMVRRGPLSSGVVTGYAQPTLVDFDPEEPQNIVAGGADSGIFLSADRGQTWTILTGPFEQGAGRPHIPRPRAAAWQHKAGSSDIDLYIGSQGRGVWRITLHRGPGNS